MHFLERCVTLLLSIKKCYIFNIIVKFNIFLDNIKYIKHAGNKSLLK